MNYDNKAKQVYFDMSDVSTLANICRTAAERYKETAADFRKLIDYKPKAIATTPDGPFEIDMTPHGEGARIIAEQFERQAQEAMQMLYVFDAAQDFGVSMDAEDFEDAVAA
ncbi:hypothetical protein Cp1R7AA1_029 [Mesorhizobium phage Cp1R7A-A1]|nr:hypothetical protein Cp1R7AA1_029 [Mesorhizobium phage Cp1R7A-A1]